MEWDVYFMNIAWEAAKKSKDPSSKFGAVLVDSEKRIVSVGFNGFPRKVRDDAEMYANRERKYRRTVHAELNALFFAQTQGHTMYILDMPCCDCMKALIQKGVERVVFGCCHPEFRERWKESLMESLAMAQEAEIDWFQLAYTKPPPE